MAAKATESLEAIVADVRAESGIVPHVLTAINAVMAEMAVGGIAKDRKNTTQNYKFRGIDDVYNALAPVLARNHLIVAPRGLGRTCDERVSKAGGAMFYVNVSMEFDLFSARDGSKITVGPFYGEAMDTADKATNKAQSAAFKYMAMQAFCIPTEGDNDADATTHEVASRQEQRRESPPSDRQQSKPPTFKQRVETAKAELSACEYPAELTAWAGRNKTAYEDLPDDDYNEIMSHFTACRKAFTQQREPA